MLFPPILGCLVCLFLNKQNYASYLLCYPYLTLPLKGRELKKYCVFCSVPIYGMKYIHVSSR